MEQRRTELHLQAASAFPHVLTRGLDVDGSVPNLLKLLSEFAIFTPPAIML
jgi:hypothetical protein